MSVDNVLLWLNHFSKGIFDDLPYLIISDMSDVIKTELFLKYHTNDHIANLSELETASDLVYRRTVVKNNITKNYVVCYWRQSLFIFLNQEWIFI
jgi:hypothetical protein